jgi:DNA-binding response OmpR family regulator
MTWTHDKEQELQHLKKRLAEVEEAMSIIIEGIDEDFAEVEPFLAALMPQERKLFRFLSSNKNVVITYDSLYDALYWDKPNCNVHPEIIKVLVAKINRRFREMKQPLRVINYRYVGYKLVDEVAEE